MTLTRRTVLAAGATSVLAACSKLPENPQAELDLAKLEALATSLVRDMVADKFSTTLAIEDDTMKAALDESKLRQAWQQASAPKGAFVHIDGTAATKVKDSAVVIVVATFGTTRLTIQYSFNAAGQIDGLFFRDSTAADLANVGVATASAVSPATGKHSVDHMVQVGKYALAGTLVTPATTITPRNVVVLLVAGSGPQDMDETIGRASNKPLRDMADALAALGISSLRYNKRFQQRPDTAGTQWTLDAEVLDDVAAAIELLRSRQETSSYRIVVAGHSLGGMLLPRILATMSGLAGAVSLAGSPRSFFDILLDQGTAQITASVASKDDRETRLKALRAQVEQAKALTNPKAAAILDMPASYIVDLNAVHAGLRDDIAKTKMPWLILQGGDDAQVYPDKDYPAWKTFLAGQRAEYHLFKGLNHLFMPTAKTKGVLDYDTANSVSPEVASTISAWVKTQVQA